MSKQFRYCDLHQAYLLPPSLQDWLPEGHLARFVADLVETLDLSAMYAQYAEGDGRGLAAYDPRLMVRLLLYAYCRGVPGSRRIERATYEGVAFRYLAADQHPDHDTIAAFRKEHLTNLAQLFVQVLQLCQRAGLVKLGHVALDGTKVKAKASKHKAMSYGGREETEKKLEEEVQALLQEAARIDAEEDGKYGKGKRGDELPEELARRESRLKKLRAAKAALEAEPKAQRNFTDPDSRLMKDGASKEFVQAYNAQAAVDSQAQVIVATALTQEANDQQLVPMLEEVEVMTGSKPQPVRADSGYFSEANVTDRGLAGIDLCVPPDGQKHGKEAPVATEPPPPGAGVAEQMRHKLRTPAGRAVHKLRKAVVEPVFGQIKEGRGFRRFLLRGLGKVRAEWKLICATHNLLQLFQSGWSPQRA